MPKKILFCASTISHIKNFHLPYLKAFKQSGYEVWVASNKNEDVLYADHVVALPLCKNLVSIQNVKAIFKAKRLLKNQNFDIVSTHTTLASAVVRAAIILIHKKPKVFCTVHGYLFNENTNIKKLIYLLPEKICASVTNVLMVMNNEDYKIAKGNNLYRDKLFYINGMGIDLTHFTRIPQKERNELRKNLGFSDSTFLFLYVAEFSKRKNQSLLIRAFANICKSNPEVKLLLAGEGSHLEDCKLLAKELHVERQIKFLGYVKDIKRLYSMSDVYVTTSRIEGMPFNVMEAMACGLPVIASKIKGHIELIIHEKTGILFELEEQIGLENAMIRLLHDQKTKQLFKQNGSEHISKFGLDKVFPQIVKIYREN